MEQKRFLGLYLTPRKEYRKEIARLEELYQQEKTKSSTLMKERNDAFARLHQYRNDFESLEKKCSEVLDSLAQWKQKYHDLLKDTPARGKGGKFVKRNKA